MKMKRQLYFPLLLTLLASLVFGVFPLGQATTVYAATTLALYPGTVTTTDAQLGDPLLDMDWLTPANVDDDDGVYAQITDKKFDKDVYSYRLDAVGFGFEIPDGATIDGIVVEYERKDIDNETSDAAVLLIKEGTVQGSNLSSGAIWQVSDTMATFGSSTEKWGLIWTPALINASNFGVAVAAVANANNATPDIDYLRIIVHYTPPPLPSISNSPGSFDFPAVTAGSTPNTTTGWFTITNSSNVTIDINIKCDDWSFTAGSNNWIYGASAPDTARLKASNDQGGVGGSTGAGQYDIIVPSGETGTLFCNDVATGTTTINWELQLEAPSGFTHNDPQITTVTLTATAA